MSAISLRLTKDTVSPSLARLADDSLIAKCTLAAGTVIGAIAQRSFDESSLRVAPWPERKKPAPNPLLIKSGTLRQSIHVKQEGTTTVRIGTPVKYGAVHQLGSAKKSGRGSGIPARPFFPVDASGQLSGEAKSQIDDAVKQIIDAAK